jgi:hypothetical protein
MTLHDALIFVVSVVFAGILSGIAQARFPAPDPNAKRIAYLERRVRELSKQLGIEEAPLNPVQDEIVRGRKINAIKLYREQTGVSLVVAKEAVESMEAQMKAQGLA